MNWLRMLWKSTKTTAVTMAGTTIANHEEIISNAIVSAALGVVRGFFNWVKNRKKHKD